MRNAIFALTVVVMSAVAAGSTPAAAQAVIASVSAGSPALAGPSTDERPFLHNLGGKLAGVIEVHGRRLRHALKGVEKI